VLEAEYKTCDNPKDLIIKTFPKKVRLLKLIYLDEFEVFEFSS